MKTSFSPQDSPQLELAEILDSGDASQVNPAAQVVGIIHEVQFIPDFPLVQLSDDK